MTRTKIFTEEQLLFLKNLVHGSHATAQLKLNELKSTKKRGLWQKQLNLTESIIKELNQ